MNILLCCFLDAKAHISINFPGFVSKFLEERIL